MPTAITETAPEVEVFRHEAKIIRQVVQMNVEGFTHEESLIQPSPAGNCLNWVMGHLLTIYERMLPYMGQKAVLEPDALKRYVRGSSPLPDATEALDFQVLLTAWNEANDRIDAGLANLTTEALDGPAPFSPSNNPKETVRSLITTALFHQAYHSGQAGLLRRIAGKEGAIR
jgi:hypothetical protein